MSCSCGGLQQDSDADIAKQLVVSGLSFVDLSRPGLFVITYDVTDSTGYAAVSISRIVEVRCFVALRYEGLLSWRIAVAVQGNAACAL